MSKRRVPFGVAPVRGEFEGSALGDARRQRRLIRIVERMEEEPSRSFPDALLGVAELEAGYRFFGNEDVGPEAILAPHRDQTWKRAAGCQVVLSVEDTTEMRFGGASRRPGLGSLLNGGHGFYLHAALLVGLYEGRSIPLGEAAHEVLVRREREGKRPAWRDAYADPDKESLRWNRVMEAVDKEAGARGVRVVHVADREASQYDLLASCYARRGRFVVRLRRGFLDRAEPVEQVDGFVERQVALSPRLLRQGQRSAVQPRVARSATLRFSASRIRLQRPDHVSRELPSEMELGLVLVTEQNPPDGCEPISWTLLTTEAVSTMADVETVVDAYRARWLIEEFWKAIKTGCDYEARQLESLHALHNALALCIPLAWHMLLLRNIARDAPATPAQQLVSPMQMQILLAMASGTLNERGIKLSATPDATELLYAVARLGGHLPRNGTPGWITLRRGLDQLYQLQAAALLLRGGAM